MRAREREKNRFNFLTHDMLQRRLILNDVADDDGDVRLNARRAASARRDL